MKVRIATGSTNADVDHDEPLLLAALDRAGFDAELLAWDDPQADWSGSRPTVLRSTWNYIHAPERFVAWLDALELSGPVWNPPDVVRANLHKGYLLELAARGVPIVPTSLLRRGDPSSDVVRSALAASGGTGVVVKPAVGAGSFGAGVFHQADAAQAHGDTLLARGDVLVQPFMPSVADHGERSLIWIGGDFTHVIRKAPRFAGSGENITGPLPFDASELVVARAALEPWADRLLYARVDLVRDDSGNPCVMELELIEPSLYFTHHPPALDAFVAALRGRLAASSADKK